MPVEHTEIYAENLFLVPVWLLCDFLLGFAGLLDFAQFMLASLDNGMANDGYDGFFL